MRSKQKNLIIGIDGATFSVVNFLITRGKLPNIANIINKGACGELTSVLPLNSIAAWTSFATGRNPAKHGLFGFLGYPTEGYNERKIVNSTYVSCDTLWDIFTRENRKSIVINLPGTYPPKQINGAIVTGILTPPGSSNFTYPPELSDEIRKKLGDYQTDTFVGDISASEDDYLKEQHYITEKRQKLILHLIKKYDWDLFTAVFTGLDRLQHFFWKYMDTNHPLHNQDPEKTRKYGNVITDFYVKLDGMIGEIISNVGNETNIIVLSDHGFGPTTKKINLNQWLHKEKLLKVKEDTSRKDMILGAVLAGAKKLIKGNTKKLIKRAINFHYVNEIEWNHSVAYGAASNEGGIYINLKEREPKGIVQQKEYERIRNHIISQLLELKDPDNGEQVIEKVLKKEEILEGPYLEYAPDLFIFTNSMKYETVAEPVSKYSRIITPQSRKSGIHRINGIFMAMGQQIESGRKLQNLSILDIAPMVLHMTGLKIPNDMDGQIPKLI